MSVTTTAIDTLRNAGLEVEPAECDRLRVNGTFNFWTTTKYWRGDDGLCGYGLTRLITTVRKMEAERG